MNEGEETSKRNITYRIATASHRRDLESPIMALNNDFRKNGQDGARPAENPQALQVRHCLYAQLDLRAVLIHARPFRLDRRRDTLGAHVFSHHMIDRQQTALPEFCSYRCVRFGVSDKHKGVVDHF